MRSTRRPTRPTTSSTASWATRSGPPEHPFTIGFGKNQAVAMGSGSARPAIGRRVAAIASIVLVVGVVVASLAIGADEPLRVLTGLALLVVFLASVWVALTRVGRRRLVAVVIAVAAAVGLAFSVVNAEGLLGPTTAMRSSHSSARSPSRSIRSGRPPVAQGGRGGGHPRATRDAWRLVHEPEVRRWQGERFHLVDECRRRGIEPIVFQPGEDWLQRVRDVAQSGVDVLGMAGGDGSQAMVGTVAAEFGLPMVVVPAGTRNHLALDLGLDRNDVVGALDAYGGAVERRLDLADVNGHVFVNNVSLGLYAAIVRSPDYRDAKVDTTLATLPQVLGPETEPFDLRFTDGDGEEHAGAHVVRSRTTPTGRPTGGWAVGHASTRDGWASSRWRWAKKGVPRPSWPRSRRATCIGSEDS